MSDSSDDRRGSRRLPPPGEPETRAARRYGIDPRHLQGGDGWEAVGADSAWYDAQLRADADPAADPPTFEFQPSPLQPRVSQRIPSVAPVPPPPPGYRPPPPEAAPRPSLGVATRDAPHGALTAPARSRRADGEGSSAPVVPQGSVTSRSLTLVVAIMCFLACLTTGAVYLMRQSANAWMRDIASEITVQVEAREKADMDKVMADIAAFLEHEAGVTAARPLSMETSVNLLEPWLGQSELVESLPLPRLIAVEIDRTSPPDINALRGKLAARFQGTALDDHRHWQRQIRTVTRSFLLGGISILVLVAAATMAIIISATRSALASNREIVEVLHFVGATDKFIARQFQRHFLWLGIRAGVIGAVLAGVCFFAMPLVIELLGGGSASAAELRELIGSGSLDWIGYLWLGVVVLVIAALCRLTSRVGVYRILDTQQ